MEDDIGVDAEALGAALEAEAIRLTVVLFDVWVGRAEHDVERLWAARDDLRQRVDDMLDALVGRQEPKGQNDGPVLDADLMFAPARGRGVGDPMVDEVDLVGGHAVHLAEKLCSLLAHDDEALGQPRELVHHAPLLRRRFGEDGVQRRDDRHPELAEEREDVGARLSAVDPVFVLDGHHIDVVDVEKISRSPV